MTKNLERAFAEASKLPEREQNAVARWILAEIASDRAWEDAFAGSRDKLAELGAEALREHRAGRSKRLDAEKLVKSRTTARFRAAFAELPEQIQDRARKAYRLFRVNPKHPSLRFKRVHPDDPIYSVRGVVADQVVEQGSVADDSVRGEHLDLQRTVFEDVDLPSLPGNRGVDGDGVRPRASQGPVDPGGIESCEDLQQVVDRVGRHLGNPGVPPRWVRSPR